MPTDLATRQEDLKSLQQIFQAINVLVALLGDFNAMKGQKLTGLQTPCLMFILISFTLIEVKELEDMNKKYKWSNNGNEPECMMCRIADIASSFLTSIGLTSAD